MSNKLDVNEPAIVGAPPSERERIIDAVRRKCEGCGAEVWLSRCVLLDAQRQAKAMGKTGVLVCWTCAEPWLGNIAREGGELVARSERVMNQALDAVARLRRQQTEAN